LGIVLYQRAAHRHPFVADSEVSIQHAILSQVSPPLSHFTAAHVLTELDAGAAESRAASVAPPPPRHTVGREKEHVELRAAFESVATTGHGIMICIAGEPGIGKTTVIEDFLNEQGAPCAVARGRCSERLAGTEAYLPILEVLEDLLRSDSANARAIKLLAPSWYAQTAPLALADFSGAVAAAKFEAASQERLKREFVSFLQEICRAHPLILFLDDVHWADVSTFWRSSEASCPAYAADSGYVPPIGIVAGPAFVPQGKA
jgi:AAA ATPase domain